MMTSGMNESLWLDIAPAYRMNAALSTAVTADVAIIGGGLTGLCTAWHLKKADPDLNVVVLEANYVGFGPSGRAAGNCFNLFGESIEWVMTRFGKRRAIQAFKYQEEALNYMRGLLDSEGIDADYSHPGLLRVAWTPGHAKRLRKTMGAYEKLGLGDRFQWLDQQAMQQHFPASPFCAGVMEANCGLVNPLALVRGWKKMCVEKGVQIYEETPVTAIARGSRMNLTTPRGSVDAARLVLATNAYSHLLPINWSMRTKQSPVWTYMIATDVLTPQHWDAIGWQDGMGIYDNRKLLHYARRTPDGRIAMGGSGTGLPPARHMDHDNNPHYWQKIESFLRAYFPPLHDVPIIHRWGGPLSLATDMVPMIGQLGDPRIVYCCGYVGHGIPMAHLNGQLISDLIRQVAGARDRHWIVNKSTLPWLPEPFARLSKATIQLGMGSIDFLNERGFAKGGLPLPTSAATS